MLQCFSPDRSHVIRILPVTAATMPAWLERNSYARAWLSSVGFHAEPGTFAFVPHGESRPFVVAAPIEGAPVYAFSGLPTTLPEGTYALDLEQRDGSPTDAAIGWALGSYAFSTYKKTHRVAAQLAWPDNADRAEVERIVRAVFLARDMINTPAQDMGPAQLADAARAVAEAHGAALRVIVGDELLAQNYPTVHAVGRASDRPPRLIDLRWGDDAAPKVTLVGKGVCFDTGGLDLKSREGMLEMKKDMGGAAIVLALADALMAARTPIRLRVLIPAVENSVSGNAVRPRDIVRTRSGKTVEIGNTDAEGRLILCDALAEADSERPDLLVDCATLTGAARVALGPELQALYCDDEATAAGLLESGAATGDPLWRMPLWRPYRRDLESKCADLSNVAKNSFAGSIIAALYLAEFVSTPRWAHIDLYAANPSSRPGRPEGGEATGLRALYAYIRGQYARREAPARR
jgi:leucyl aminopeptidase